MIDPAGQQFIDRSVKALCRRVPTALLQLLSVESDVEMAWEDVSVNLPEHRADQVLIIGAVDDPQRWAIQLEYQLHPDLRVMKSWRLKNAALSEQLGMDVLLVAIYLSPGGHRTFPTDYVQQRGELRTRFEFTAFKLWEHADRIRSGELASLAPLLVLCEDSPAEEALLEEQTLIRSADLEENVRADLFSLAISVASRYLTREFVFNLFREDMEVLKEAGFIEEWIAEGAAKAELRKAREMALRNLRGRFGDLPSSVISEVEHADLALCDRIADNIGHAQSLGDLGLE
jgi:hypothetical protein